MDTIEKKKRPTSLRVPEQMSLWVENALRELKARGAEVSIEELFAPALARINEQYFVKRVEELTPDHHLLEIAKSHPEVLRVLSLHAKKLLEAASRGEPVRLRKKREGAQTGREAN
jgi:hypothetical protein